MGLRLALGKPGRSDKSGVIHFCYSGMPFHVGCLPNDRLWWTTARQCRA